MRYIFLVSGYMNSGKDCLSNYLVAEKNLKKYASADVLKSIIQKKYNLDKNLLLTQSGKNTIVTPDGKTARDLLIKGASEIKHLIGNNFFITYIIDKILIDDYLNATVDKKLDNVVISDFRYRYEYATILQRFNEANSLKSRTKIITIRINRYNVPPQNIASETNLDNFKFTHVVDNHGSLADFKKNIYKIIKLYKL